MEQDNKTVEIKDFKWELRKRKIREKFNKAVEFVKEHPTESLALATTAVGGMLGLVKRHDRNNAVKEQQRLKDEYIYDRSLGTYWKTRRKRTPGENLEIERRRRNGESLGEILSSMKLL